MSRQDETRRQQRSAATACDILLVLMALVAAFWVFWHAPSGEQGIPARTVTLDDHAMDSELTIRIDAVNRICVGDDTLDSSAALAEHLSDCPRRVLLLVDPDGLLETVMGTVDVLQRAGVESIQLGTAKR